MKPPSVSFVSVFDRVFDTVVFGAGFTGCAAARTLAGRGADTLLVESSGDLLWEATRALENTAAAPAGSETWGRWLQEIHPHANADDGFFDPALAEIHAASELSATNARHRTLLYAAPVAVGTNSYGIGSVIVATKGGARRLRARCWIDATETGQLTRLACADASPRNPATRHRSLVLHTLQPESLDRALAELAASHRGLECLPSVRDGERRLRWPVTGGDQAWHRKVPALVRDLRALLTCADGSAPADFIVSHCAMADFPVYAAGDERRPANVPSNLVIASPALVNEALATPSERFELGARIAGRMTLVASAREPAAPAAVSLPAPSHTLDKADVLVAGAGTAGALAALASANSGARTVAIEFTSYPGGIGTGAGICGYFHGAKGGLQTDIDRMVQEMTALLNGTPASPNAWHHEAKKIVLLTLLEDAGVTFLGETMLAGVEHGANGLVAAALAVIDGRLTRVPAAAFVDATGDGDLAVMAGAGFSTGRPGDARTLSYSQSVFALTKKENRLALGSCNFDAGWVDPTDPEDLSRARLSGIAQHLNTAWAETDCVVAVAPLIGLRQSRQISTDYQVTMTDLTDGARFEDSIGAVETVADTHSVDFEFETDEMAFYYWTCHGFRNPLRSELPYRMLLPRGLSNVWIACRAAGIKVEAAYGLRMQRDMQRLGEAAGIAAALAASARTDARGVDLAVLQARLVRSGAVSPRHPDKDTPSPHDLLADLDAGFPGIHLWRLFHDTVRLRQEVLSRLESPNPHTSFYAATILAMWNDPVAEPRLIAALLAREKGPSTEERPVFGAFAQCIALPFWLQAVLLLRRVGTGHCLPALETLAAETAQPFNVRTLLALTLERLAARLGVCPGILNALESLTVAEGNDAMLPPSRSIWRTLHGEPQKKLRNDRGAPVEQDHGWQLHLVIARTRKLCGLPPDAPADASARDPRAFVRNAFDLKH